MGPTVSEFGATARPLFTYPRGLLQTDVRTRDKGFSREEVNHVLSRH